MASEGRGTTIGEHMTSVTYSVGDDQNLAEVTLRMRDLGVHHMPVMRGSRLVGIISERDIAIHKATTNARLDELPVTEAMTRDPYQVPPTTPLAQVAQEMGAHHYGTTLVVEDGEVKGIFSTTDALFALARLCGE